MRLLYEMCDAIPDKNCRNSSFLLLLYQGYLWLQDYAGSSYYLLWR